MQVQLIVANEHHNGRAIPVNVPSFMIGRAEGCNLRSRSPQVSRFHCTIVISNGTVIVQDLGGENGTFVNGSRVSASQALNDGDKLVVGTHSFVVSIKAGTSKAGTSQEDFFELTPSSVAQPKTKQGDPKNGTDSDKTVVIKENIKKSEQEAEIMFEIRLDGQRISITKSRLFDLARKGSILPDDLVVVAGTKVFADSIQGIVFGDQSPVAPLPPTPPVTTSTDPAIQPAPVAPATDPFAFPDLGGIADGTSPFDNITSEPFVRVVRKESAFHAIWNALDISFSRVYTMEGNNLVIHSLKALYYVLVVGCIVFALRFIVDFCLAWHKSGNLLQELQSHYMGLASTVFGGVIIIVIVRVLLEMLLLAWIESAKGGSDDENK